MRPHTALALAIALSLGACDRPAPPTSAKPSIAAPPTSVPAPVAAEPLAPKSVAPAARHWHTLTSADGGFTVRYAFEPDPIATRDPFAIAVELFEDPACTKPLAGGALLVDAAMPEHGHGMNVRPKVTDQGHGAFRVEGMLFHMAGRWELFFDRTADDQTERAQATVRIELTN